MKTPSAIPADSKRARKHNSFKKASRKADAYANDPKKLKNLIDLANKRASGKAGARFEQIWEDLQTVFAMLRAYAKGDYREIPYKVLVSLIAAVVYFISPIDLIPDFIIPVGFLDDVAVLGWAINEAREHIDRFRDWAKTIK